MAAHGTVRAHRLLVPGLVFIGMVVAIVSSLGAPLVPTLATVDRVPVSAAQWSLTLPLLVSAVATPAMGRLGDGPHRRPMILFSLGIVAVGGALAALPLGFGLLLVGRGLQGVGLGLIPLAIAVANDALPAERAQSAVAMLSITVVAGIGLGYPLTGLIAQYGGLHAAYWFGVAVTGSALVVAAVVVPSTGHRPPVRLDFAGALLLGAALAAVLLAVSEGVGWGWTSARVLGLLVASLVLLLGWIWLELSVAHPLVELRLLRQSGVSTAGVMALLAGVGMYLLISLVTRLVQTPVNAGYGFGEPVVVAGLMLVPFSVASAAAGRGGPALARRTSPGLVLLVGCVVLIAAMSLFICARDRLWEIAVVMGVAGLGIGAVFAVIPGLVVRAVPSSETGSAMSFNQVLRYVGYGLGSALSAVVLQSHTPAGKTLPLSSGYTAAGIVACGTWVVTAVASQVVPRLRRRPPAEPEQTVEQGGTAALNVALRSPVRRRQNHDDAPAPGGQASELCGHNVEGSELRG